MFDFTFWLWMHLPGMEDLAASSDPKDQTRCLNWMRLFITIEAIAYAALLGAFWGLVWGHVVAFAVAVPVMLIVLMGLSLPFRKKKPKQEIVD